MGRRVRAGNCGCCKITRKCIGRDKSPEGVARQQIIIAGGQRECSGERGGLGSSNHAVTRDQPIIRIFALPPKRSTPSRGVPFQRSALTGARHALSTCFQFLMPGGSSPSPGQFSRDLSTATEGPSDSTTSVIAPTS